MQSNNTHSIFLPKLKTEPPEINLSPLIDVVFLLLIFFMVTSVFPEKDGIIIEKPESEHATSLNEKNVIIKIDTVGSVYYQNQVVTTSDLNRILSSHLKRENQLSVIIQADKKATTQALLTVIGIAKKNGATQIGLAANEKAK